MIQFKEYQNFEACHTDSVIREFLFEKGFTYREMQMAESCSATVFTDSQGLYIFMAFGELKDQSLLLLRIKDWKANPHKLLSLIDYFHNYMETENNGDAVKMAIKLLRQKTPFPLYG